MAVTDRQFLSNDADSAGYDEHYQTFGFANESSAHTGSATLIPLLGPVDKHGRILEVVLGVARPALSASGFVSGTVEADVNINSATCLSTKPSIAMVATSALAVRRATNVSAAGGTAAVVNLASAKFSAGDQISISYNARSVGSAAAGAAGIGFYVRVKYRYGAA